MNQTPTKTTRRARPLRRRLLFAGVLAALFLVLVEAISHAAFWFLDGTVFSWSRVHEHKSALAAGKEVDVSGRAAQAGRLDCFPHPHVGDVLRDNAMEYDIGSNGRMYLRPFNDVRTAYPRRSAATFIVGVLGGSVAYSFAVDGAAVLCDELAQDELVGARRIVIVNMATPAWKQPQQLLALTFAQAMGAEFDVVVNLDGINEICMAAGHAGERVHPAFPMAWRKIVENVQDPELQRGVALVVFHRHRRRDWARAFDGFLTRRSATLQLIWKVRDRWLQASIAEARGEVRRQRAVAEGNRPGKHVWYTEMSERGIREWTRSAWRHCSELLHRSCEANDTLYLHCLQPNQYVRGSKPMGAPEKKIALSCESFRRLVPRGYGLLLEGARRLQSAGVRFVDLRFVFRDVREQAYVDEFCHLNAHGNEVLARSIASQIRRHWRAWLERSGALGIASEPESVTLTDPTRPFQLCISKRMPDGTLRDVTRASRTSYVSNHPDVVSVTRDGSLRAHRAGEARIRVRHDAWCIVVPVRASWPPILAATAGIAGSGARVPRLEVGGKLVAGGNVRVAIEGVVGGASGTLLVSPPPIVENSTLRELPPTAFFVPIRAGGDPGVAGTGRWQRTIALPDAPRGSPTSLFLAAFFLDQGAPSGLSLSNGVVVTLP